MNTNPDETKLARWLDDELQGADLAAFEAAARPTPEMLAAREDVRRWRSMMAAAIPLAEEPPYADFFNTRIERAIRRPAVATEQAAVPAQPWWVLFRRHVLMPVAACCGMAFTFWLGMRTNHQAATLVVTPPPHPVATEPFVYTPQSGVEAERFASSPASATVIVLSGVDAIPDDTDFSKSTSFNNPQPAPATAAVEPESNDQMEL